MLTRAVQATLAASEHDAAVPAGHLTDRRAFAAELSSRLRDLADRLADTDADAVAAEEVERFFTSRPTAVRGGLRDRLRVGTLHDQTLLRRRRHTPCVLVPAGARLRVLLGDRELRVPAYLAEALEHVRAHDELRPADLAPWLDQESRRVLTRRLVVEGLLEVAE